MRGANDPTCILQAVCGSWHGERGHGAGNMEHTFVWMQKTECVYCDTAYNAFGLVISSHNVQTQCNVTDFAEAPFAAAISESTMFV